MMKLTLNTLQGAQVIFDVYIKPLMLKYGRCLPRWNCLASPEADIALFVSLIRFVSYAISLAWRHASTHADVSLTIW